MIVIKAIVLMRQLLSLHAGSQCELADCDKCFFVTEKHGSCSFTIHKYTVLVI